VERQHSLEAPYHVTRAIEQRELARWLVDRGADLVIGSHPHCVQPIDFYHGCPIAYSLGNLVFDGAPTVASWNRGALLEVGLNEAAKISSVSLIPVVLEDGLPRVEITETNRFGRR
jgi:poly-gamma-glutamate synthesis protein (capsule biosynthesis protein)